LKERYKDNSSIHLDLEPDLWLETGSSNRPNRNQVYGLFNITTDDLWTVYVSTINSNSRVWDDFRPMSSNLNDSSYYWLCMTRWWDSRTLSISNEWNHRWVVHVLFLIGLTVPAMTLFLLLLRLLYSTLIVFELINV